MKKILWLILILLSISLIACGGNSYDGGLNIGNLEPSINAKIYYEVEYVLEGNVDENIKEVENYIKNYDGYIEEANEYVEDNYRRAYIVYRIKTENLNEFLTSLNKNSSVSSKNIYSYDITSDYNWTEQKLKTLYAAKTAYENLLENTTNVSDIILLTDKLTDVNSEIMALEEDMAIYNNKLSYSKVTISFTEHEENFFSDYLSYLSGFFIGFVKVVLYLLPFGFVGVLFICGVIVIVKIDKKRKLKKNGKDS